MLRLAIALFLPFSAISAQLTSPLGPVVDLGYAAFAGNSTPPSSPTNPDAPVVGPVTFFGGVPYAQPPLGDLRWRAPRNLEEDAKSSGTITDARSWGPPCIQRPAVVGVGTEDCLTLNIWKPTKASEGDNLPVAVYIHGGGFYANSPQGFPLYDWVAQHPTEIVGVSITYRLGMMGFLGGPTIPAFHPNTGNGDLNVGLLDQRAGLEWVQRHISKFGGDPDNVAIYGESAGGAGVVMQVTAYGGTKPVPFKRATPQSIGFGPTRNDSQIEQNFVNAAKFIGCPTIGNTSDILSCMRNASLGAIVSAINRTPNGEFAPVVEGPGGFLPDLPSRLIASGNFSAVEYNGGHCTGDGKTFASGSPDQFVTDEDIKRIVFSRWPGVSEELRDEALTLYPLSNNGSFPTEWDRAWNMAGQAIFTCMDWFLAEGLSAKGVKNVYSFAWNAPNRVLYDARPYLGTMHTSDIYFLFDGYRKKSTFGNAGNTFTPFNSSESLISREAIAYWTSFGASGDPSVSKLPNSPPWEPFLSPTNGTRQRLKLTRGDEKATLTEMEEISDAEIERCKFWMSERVTNETRI
ncbi:alpha/beta-hydrolase [Marasmius fiardii PR-910]|nr:alpha/beta-hydrolase [Marasmius fiardii PR-910]